MYTRRVQVLVIYNNSSIIAIIVLLLVCQGIVFLIHESHKHGIDVEMTKARWTTARMHTKLCLPAKQS